MVDCKNCSSFNLSSCPTHMATRQRKANKPQEAGKKDKPGEKNKPGEKDKPGDNESGKSEGKMDFDKQYKLRQKKLKKGGVSWAPVFKTLAFFFLLIAIPTLLNYAVLNQEARMLVPAGKINLMYNWN